MRTLGMLRRGAMAAAALLGLAAVAGWVADARGGDVPTVLVGAHLLNPAGDGWLEGRDVLVSDGRIASIAVHDGAAGPLPANTRRIDVTGLWIIPGLIDLHTHLLLRSYDVSAWNDQVLKESLERRTIRATVSARETLMAGFTTVRELGTEGAAWADVALRDAIAAGEIEGPRVFAATRAIVATATYGPSGFDPRWEVPKGAQETSGADEMRKAVRQQIAAGADWIKVYADYRRGPGQMATPTLTDEELRAAVSEAASAGRKVAAHATTDEGIRRAVLAGVATIEHGYGVSRDTLVMMKERGTVLVPTLSATDAIARYGGWRPMPGPNGARGNGGAPSDGPLPAQVAQSRAMLKMALEVGVKIASGSDAGVFPHGDNARELELLVNAGMSPARALRAATADAALVLGKEKELGSIAEGFAADMVVLGADPLKEIGAVRQVVVVVKEGRVARER